VLVTRLSLASITLLDLKEIFVLPLPAHAAADGRPPLVPQPPEYAPRGNLSLNAGARILVPGGNAQERFAARDRMEGLETRGVRFGRTAAAVRIYLLRANSPLARQVLRREHETPGRDLWQEGCLLVGEQHQAFIIGHTAPGVFCGAQTRKPLARAGGADPIPEGALIRDWPAMRRRGVHDDLSRGPLPTQALEERQIRTFAAYQLHVYSPYFEKAMQYTANPLPALPGGSTSAGDAKMLVACARRCQVTIIAEQEAAGHLQKVLLWQKCAPLAENPSGAVLVPGQPGSLQRIVEDIDELAEIDPGPFLHIGADETFQPGQGQTAQTVQEHGRGAVYIDYLLHIHEALEPPHRRLLFWCDMAMHGPNLVQENPHDMIAVAWEYDPEPDGYLRWIDPYTNAGMEAWVSQGVSSRRRVWPNFDLALWNIQGFTADGQKAGCPGMLNTVRDDEGKGLFLQDWYGVLFGAAVWQPGTSSILQFEHEFSPVFHGDESGDIDEAEWALIDAQEALERAGLADSRDEYFWVDPWSAEGREIAARIRPVSAQVRLDAGRALTLHTQARAAGPLRHEEALQAMDLGARRIHFLPLKFQLADQIAQSGRRPDYGQKAPSIPEHMLRDLYHLDGVNGLSEDLRDDYNYLRSRYSTFWLMENRPYWLNNVTEPYDAAAILWIRRSNRLNAAHEGWEERHRLPPPQWIGIPPAAATP